MNGGAQVWSVAWLLRDGGEENGIEWIRVAPVELWCDYIFRVEFEMRRCSRSFHGKTEAGIASVVWSISGVKQGLIAHPFHFFPGIAVQERHTVDPHCRLFTGERTYRRALGKVWRLWSAPQTCGLTE
jgi:hypothetical protein